MSEKIFTCPKCSSHQFGTSENMSEAAAKALGLDSVPRDVNCHGYNHYGHPCRWSGAYTEEGLGEDNYRRMTACRGTVGIGTTVQVSPEK